MSTFQAIANKARKLLTAMSWWEVYGVNILVNLLRVVLLVAGFWVFSHGLVYKIVGLAMIAYASFGLAVTLSHDTSHHSVVKNRKVNQVLAYVVSDFFAGQSSKWWNDRHVRIHHLHTNMEKKVGSVFAFGRMPPFLFFFVLPYAALPYVVGFSFHFLWGRWKDLGVYVVLMLAGIAVQAWLFALFVPWYYALACVFIARSLFAPIVLHLGVMHHAGMVQFDRRPAWFAHQAKTTFNIRPNLFLWGLVGNALTDCHLEHHLLPNVPDLALRKIKPVVAKHVRKAGIRYIERGYGETLRLCYTNYDAFFVQPGRAAPSGSSRT
ncbi:hypothetical protein CMO91_05620 [Candidatus Woesearchaeota archaeon]|nr:hypothetical protein [Candidatus Woesearchaeota archaeon]